MAEFLLELLSEEIPARMQTRAADDLERLVAAGLKEAGLPFERIAAYATPRRLALCVDGLPKAQADLSEERRGPRVDAPEKAIEGFLASVGLSRDALEHRQTEKGEFYFATIERKGRPAAEVLAALLPGIFQTFPWPKSMRWGGGRARWVRPLHGLLCLFDGKVVPVAFDGMEASDRTLGHRFLAPKPFRVKHFADYRERLRAAYVMLEKDARIEAITADATLAAKDENLRLAEAGTLLEEVAGLVEWPVVLLGDIDPKFMALPSEVLTTVMRAHQKYFALTDPDGKLAPRFVLVSNVQATDGGGAIVAGNERVLRARLEDAQFFWDQDRKRQLVDWFPGLHEVVFHAGLGSLADRAFRLQELADGIGQQIGAKAKLARRAGQLAKCDLLSGMVHEFPELQGVMGRYYAAEGGEPPEVAAAMAEHYAPQGPNDACPAAPVSVALALADKIDQLTGFFAIGEKPTGSKDPFALRRAALGVIRLILENKLRLPLRALFQAAFRLQPEAVRAALGKDAEAGIVADLLDFFADRLKVHLKEKGIRHDHISAVFALTGEDDFVRLLERVAALREFLASEDGANLLVAYRRARNIVHIEEKNDATTYDGAVKSAALRESQEQALQTRLEEVQKLADAALKNEEFATAMSALARLRLPVDAFFDHVTVNTEDKALRANRLHLLANIRRTLESVADFSKIEG
ncbi:MAG: glycine--tRNA ligase subunit beta [Alphaproteobacteria bacterium]|nr:glycine--tRNA ligase subunit beta [Alphaproteobacteria bacterium]